MLRLSYAKAYPGKNHVTPDRNPIVAELRSGYEKSYPGKRPCPPLIKAVEMTRQIRDRHAEQLAGKTHAERIAFYREQTKKIQKKLPALLRDSAALQTVTPK